MQEHILQCVQCRELWDQELLLARLSFRFPNIKSPVDRTACPSGEKWRELAAGLHSRKETHRQLEHATECAQCATRLRLAAEEFADETTEEENQALPTLRSSDAEWQANLARRLQNLCVQPSEFRVRWWRRHAFTLQVAISLCLLAFLVAGVFWVRTRRPSNAVNRLLSEAYSEQRSLDVRMVGARYAPIEVLRGNETSRLRHPTSLLEAEVAIANELASKPDDTFWLDAQGRADLMDDNYASALLVLERARRYAPDSTDIRIDLANAYFLRAEELNRLEDYGRSVELLGQILAKDPGNTVARFNRAVSSDRLLLYEPAMEDWREYLKLDPNSRWSDEARERLSRLEEKLNLQKNHAERPLLDPAEFLALYNQGQGNLRQDLDQRIERYFELALLEWIPQAFSNTPAGRVDTVRRACDRLAQLLIARHADYWLADFLRELTNKPLSRKALPFLVDSLKSGQTADLEHAHKAALDAAFWFRNAANRPGELVALFEASYADQLAHQVATCRVEARLRDDALVARRYPWIRAQYQLESAACTNLNDESARAFASQALALAKLHHFSSLELRAITFLAALYQYMGDNSSAWKYSAEGLARFWEGDYPSVRGYGLYAGLDLVAEEAEQWFLDTRVIQEASQLIDSDPDLQLRAVEQRRLSNAFAMTGDFRSADKTLAEAQALFAHSADGARKDNLEFESQTALAKFELMRSEPSAAIHRLEPLRGKVSGLSDKDLAFDYFRNLGLAYFAVGASLSAKQNLDQALALVEQSLGTDNNERERLIWCRKAESVYRALAQLALAGSPKDAFAQWEWFKGASLRGNPLRKHRLNRGNNASRAAKATALSFIVPTDTIVVSYAFLPEGTFVWMFNHDGVRQQRLPVSAREVELLALRFADHCSRPDSNRNTIDAEGRLLYQKLFEPIESSLSFNKHLVIEPDKDLWLIPFEALRDENGSYLGDRYAISMSPGLDYLAISAPWEGISSESHILIAGDPVTHGRKPLEDAEEEAKGIARQFRFTHLLMKREADYQRIAEQMRNAEIFHFSGHAAASPEGVGLLLGDSMVMDTARMNVSQFSKMKLAVLSACDTAKGGSGVFDDRDSLARLLIGAGVLEVVASRWAVDSRATAVFMNGFYAQLLTGKNVSFSLRDASRKLRETGEFTHPFYWAGFSAFGKS